MEESNANCIKFSDLCILLEQISTEEDRGGKEVLFKQFINFWFQKGKRIFTIFPALRLMTQPINIGERLIIEFNYLKNILLNDLKIDELDFGMTKEMSISKMVEILINIYPKSFEELDFSVEYMNMYIDQLSQCIYVEKNIIELLRKMSYLERKWFLLIILNEVENVTKMDLDDLFYCINPNLEQFKKYGFQFEDILANYSPNYFIKEDIKHTLPSLGIGKPFTTMKPYDFGYEKYEFDEIKKCCKGKLFVELFCHGEHVLLHRFNNGANYKFFSSNKNDYTMFYTLPKFDFPKEINSLFKIDVKDVILEGYMVIKCNKTGRIMKKYDMSSDDTYYDSRLFKEKDDCKKICFIVSDILYLNSNFLTNISFEERLEILNEKIFNNIENTRIIISKYRQIQNYKDFTECVENAISDMEEGFFIKDSSSFYIHGNSPRSNCVFHVKPDYNKFCTFNLGIVGIEYSDNTFSHVKNFLLAANGFQNTLTICLKIPVKMESIFFNKIIDVLDINNKYHLKLPCYLEDNLNCNSLCRFAFEENITIVEVKWTKICSNYKDLIYIYCIKKDLLKKDISLLIDVQEFDNRFNRGLNNVEVIPPILNIFYCPSDEVKKPRIKLDVLENWKFFEKLTICILNYPKHFDLKRIQQFIYFLGASVVSNPTKDTSYIIATDKLNIKTAAAIHTKYMPILDVEWVIRCINEKRIQKIDLEKDTILMCGHNQLSLEKLNDLIQEKDIPDEVFNNIFM
ncbi:DNA ligase 4 [Strongyloides ratti]|uniref:DNA ligase 4 n=1 Tax=Strongyloides ratti TaxID=34506 RepID=A0A090L5C9_STRRB|nr:DNA ligase 4 [Strongyloides ratti]CEF64932.1 DNA ligase 4 [Strongyloides ratti]